mmetsp:Transcript_27951/g.65615  ORF Transcript_27951/g.65615 Transcript_27951/m.65615 type:complete len:213 (+) Transcript_27951:93-731(+)|eukprot:CAMPEP_0185806972 /NCGR_PEP_ID=MMETSP1322-20130828/4738_1 /TAXON_ID=265543 /ORGANISM="Minutocellus polymorphus, Strain RCC2270" /LENGTH=212 /DNA_ID=CAMNT_0028503079 /DNA_START=29 /DNA_END=667 /DNA_ORIENTATION=+
MSTRQGRRSLKLDGGGGKKGKDLSSSAKQEEEKDVSAGSAEAEGANNSSSFFSPKRSTKKAATVTPSPSAAKKRRSLLLEGETPKAKSKKKKQKLEEAKVSATTTDEEPYVPTYIHKNVGYSSFGTATDRLTDGQKLAFNFVVEQYHIPSDFETNRKYGPLSGTSYEERVLAAYATNGLDPSEDADSTLIRKGICTFCGIVGHRRKLCPDLI